MTRLSEAYIHLKSFDLSEKRILDLEQYLKVTGRKIGKEIYDSSIEVQVEIEKGSIRIRTILGGILSVLILRYGDVRTSVDYLIKDGRKAAEIINSHVVKKVRPEPEQIYRTERRLAVPGQLQMILRELDAISNNLNELSPDAVKQKIGNINRRLIKVLNTMVDTDDQKFLVQALKEDSSFKKLPEEMAGAILSEIDEFICVRCAPKERPKIEGRFSQKIENQVHIRIRRHD